MADCQFTAIPKLSVFPPSNKSYSEITGAEHQTEVEEFIGDEGDKSYTYSYYLILFTSGRILDKVEVNSNNRAQWASDQINQDVSRALRCLFLGPNPSSNAWDLGRGRRGPKAGLAT